MSYRIHYQSTEKKLWANIRLPVLTVLCFLLFYGIVSCRWPEGAAYLSNKIHSLKESAAVASLNQLSDDLFRGEPLTEVFSDFCKGLYP